MPPGGARPGRHPVRRRLRRRHAAHRRPLHRASSAVFGNDLATLPDFPAEIRAPAGTIAGVSAFQVHISDHDIITPGDAPNVLVAMNPAALQGQPRDLLEPGGTLHRQRRRVRRAQPRPRPATPPTRSTTARSTATRVYEVPMTSLTIEARRAARREAARRRALEELLRPRPDLVDVHPARPSRRSSGSQKRFAKQPAGARRQPRRVPGRLQLRRDRRAVRPPATRSSRRQLRAGHVPQHHRQHRAGVGPRRRRPAGQAADLPRSYPITPASDILHELSKHKNFGVRTLQAEDEIAGVGVALGAAFAGHLGVTDHERSRRRPRSREAHRPRGQPRAAAAASSTSSAAARRPACRPRPSRPTCCSRCTAATARRRCRSSPPYSPRTASTPRSRRCASR